MLQSQILINGSSIKFKAQALADFTSALADKYGKVIEFLQRVIGSSDEELNTWFWHLKDGTVLVLQSLKDLWIETLGFPVESICSLPIGYITWEEVLLYISYRIDEQVEGTIFPDINLTNADGEIVGKLDKSTDLLNLIQMNYHSTISFAAASEACAINGVSDRLTVFRDTISSVFNDAYSDLSGSIARFVQVLKIDDASVALDSLIAGLSLDKLAEDGNAVDTMNKTDLGLYTGANPMAAYDASSVTDAVIQTGRIAARVIKGAIEGITNVTKKLIRKIGNFFKTNTYDPVDLQVVNEDSSAAYSIDAFCWSRDAHDISFHTSQLPIQRDIPSFINSFNGSHGGFTHKYEFISGEILFYFDSIDYDESSELINVHGLKWALKPYAVNIGRVKQIAEYSPDMHFEIAENKLKLAFMNVDDGNFNAFGAFLGTLSVSNPLLDVTSDNEPEMLNGINFGRALCVAILEYGYAQLMSYRADDYGYWITEVAHVSEGVTNADFVYAASGFNDLGQNEYNHIAEGVPTSSLVFFERRLIQILAAQKSDEFVNPFGYCFIPYRKNIDTFNSSRFGIKTDYENASNVNSFLDGVVAFTIVAAAAIAIGIGVKALSNAITRAALSVKSSLDAKIRSGAKLSASELSKYRRANSRVNCVQSLAGNLRSSSASLTDGTDDNVQYIISLIN